MGPNDYKKDIVWKELFATTAAINSWGHHWQQKKVLFYSDNQFVYDIWRRGSSQSPEVMALVRMLYVKFEINIMIVHIAHSNNELAVNLYDTHTFYKHKQLSYYKLQNNHYK